MESPDFDFSVENHITIVMLRPLSDAARNWVEENLPEDTQRFGNAVVVEHRFAADILRGIVNDGLKLQAAWAGALTSLYPPAQRIARQMHQDDNDLPTGRWINGHRVEDFRVSLDEPSHTTRSGRPCCERCGHATTDTLWPYCRPCRKGTRLLLTAADRRWLRTMGISQR